MARGGSKKGSTKKRASKKEETPQAPHPTLGPVKGNPTTKEVPHADRSTHLDGNTDSPSVPLQDTEDESLKQVKPHPEGDEDRPTAGPDVPRESEIQGHKPRSGTKAAKALKDQQEKAEAYKAGDLPNIAPDQAAPGDPTTLEKSDVASHQGEDRPVRRWYRPDEG